MIYDVNRSNGLRESYSLISDIEVSVESLNETVSNNERFS